MANHPQLVQLEVPLSTLHASTARLVGASLAADAGFDIDEIDDLRLGLNEAFSFMADVNASDSDGRLRVTFEVDGPCLQVTVAHAGETGPPMAPVDDLAARILGAVVDSFSFEGGTFTMTKCSSASHS